MNKQENNKMIAEFMGCGKDEIENIHWIDTEYRYGFTSEELQYHKDWNWLMPVVNKIRSFDCEFDIEHIGVVEVDGESWVGKSISHYEFDLDLTYNAVVEFIKYKQ